MRDKDEAEYEARRTREAASTARPAVWTVVYAAAINGGKADATGAEFIADTALASFEKRFLPPLAKENEDDGA